MDICHNQIQTGEQFFGTRTAEFHRNLSNDCYTIGMLNLARVGIATWFSKSHKQNISLQGMVITFVSVIIK